MKTPDRHRLLADLARDLREAHLHVHQAEARENALDMRLQLQAAKDYRRAVHILLGTVEYVLHELRLADQRESEESGGRVGGDSVAGLKGKGAGAYRSRRSGHLNPVA